ncbi:MAG: hypothetical protein RLZZ392_109 [Pseudomonadota bacterium]|jgi:hypothetical protein
MDEIRLRLKLQNFQQEKQGDKRKENLEFKAPINQDEIDEYKADFEENEGVDDLSEPDLEETKEEAELSEAEIEQKKNEIDNLIKERDYIPERIQKYKDQAEADIESITNSNIDDFVKEKRIKKVQQNLNQSITRIEKVLIKTNNLINLKVKEIQENEDVKQSNFNQRNLVKSRNKKILESYKEELDRRNAGRIKYLDQNPEEEDEDYIQRIKDTVQNLGKSSAIKDEVALKNVVKLKEKFSTIIRNKSLIENIVKSLDEDEQSDLLKSWKKFIKVYNETYDLDSKVNLQDVLEVIKTYENPVKVELQADMDTLEKKGLVFLGKDLDVDNNAIIVQTKDDETYYLKLGNNGTILFSSSGEKGSFESFSFQRFKGKNFIEDILGIYISKQELTKILQKEIKKVKVKELSTENGNKVYGWGLKRLDDIPDQFVLGKIIIKLNKLFTKNLLVVIRNSDVYSKISGLKNIEVSDNFVKLILAIYRGEDINLYFSKLKQPEKDLYIQLLHVAGIHNSTYGSGIEKEDKQQLIEALKERLSLVEGEIEAGNNSNKLKSELKNILDKLVSLRALKYSSARKHYERILQDFFE